VPHDPRPPFVTSGLRIGTPAITTRGFKNDEVTLIANWIADILDAFPHISSVASIRNKVIDLCHAFPVYRES
jgi:glycine hydroxymethyltransferase